MNQQVKNIIDMSETVHRNGRQEGILIGLSVSTIIFTALAISILTSS